MQQREEAQTGRILSLTAAGPNEKCYFNSTCSTVQEEEEKVFYSSSEGKVQHSDIFWVKLEIS